MVHAELRNRLLSEEVIEVMRKTLAGPPCWWHEIDHSTEQGNESERADLRLSLEAALAFMELKDAE